MGPALSTLQAPIEKLPVNTEAVARYFEPFTLVGNETATELATLKRMQSAAMAWCVAFLAGTVNPGWLSFVGLSGAGKTLLARCIRDFLKNHARDTFNRVYRPMRDPKLSDYTSCYSYAQEGPFMVKWARLIDTARDGDYSVVRLTSSDFVKIIDDVGAESVDRTGKPTPFAIGTLAKICEERVGKWTVLTSNFSRRDLAERFDARIASRMMRNGGVIVDCEVRDFNLRREAQQKAAA